MAKPRKINKMCGWQTILCSPPKKEKKVQNSLYLYVMMCINKNLTRETYHDLESSIEKGYCTCKNKLSWKFFYKLWYTRN